jgi:hypothetical protein
MRSYTIRIPHQIISRRKRQAWNVAHMEGSRNTYSVWWGNLKNEDYWEDKGIDGRIILKQILQK